MYTVEDALKEVDALRLEKPDSHSETLDRVNQYMDQLAQSETMTSLLMCLGDAYPIFRFALMTGGGQIISLCSVVFEAGRLYGRAELMREIMPEVK